MQLLTVPTVDSKEYANFFPRLGRRLWNGKLVAFPTETVYGLGANGLDRNAVLAVFQVKQRPLNDPVILHVCDVEQAVDLMDLSYDEEDVVRLLAKTFWPGPLTVVAKARDHVPDEVCAGTGYVAVRSPNHHVALELIKCAGVPVAAPSANKFGHISPTLAKHVVKNFSKEDIVVIDHGTCEIGIESTVARLNLNQGEVEILRRGYVTKEMLEGALQGMNVKPISVKISEKLKCCQPCRSYNEQAIARTPEAEKEKSYYSCAMTTSPGMCVTHYSPSFPMFMMRLEKRFLSRKSLSTLVDVLGYKPKTSEAVLIDCGHQLPMYREKFFRYFNLSSMDSAGMAELMQSCFAILHEAEEVCIANPSEAKLIVAVEFPEHINKEALLAVYDKYYRAASGKHCTLLLNDSKFEDVCFA